MASNRTVRFDGLGLWIDSPSLPGGELALIRLGLRTILAS